MALEAAGAPAAGGLAVTTGAAGACANAALALAEEILGPTTYARVDMVPLDDDTPAVLELELVDPSLYLEIKPGAPDRFAETLAALVP